MAASPARLDKQRPTKRWHQRGNKRNYKRGYAVLPHAVWGSPESKPPPVVPPSKGAAKPGDSFTEATVTAQDATNAAKLGPLGYVALPTTAWTTGQAITVSTFLFNWSGTAWAAGAHA